MSDGWIERKPTPSEELGRMDEAVRSLTEQLAAETKRREGIEDELYEERLAHTAAVTRAEQAERERDNIRTSAEHWREAKERAAADNAALLEGIKALHEAWKAGRDTLALAALLRTAKADHPGAALLEERKRIVKVLDRMDVPSETDEKEKGRACDLVGRVELLATWGQRGWREHRRLKDAEPALLERMRALETLASAVREHLSPTFPSTVGDLLPVRNALAALDALKVPRE